MVGAVAAPTVATMQFAIKVAHKHKNAEFGEQKRIVVA